MTPPANSPYPPPPPQAFTCPKCKRGVTPANAMQACAGCGLQFVLRAGALSDGAVTPRPATDTKELKLKAPGLVVVSQAVLKADAIGFGALDPILGRFPMDEKGLRFEHIYSVALWRQINIADLVTFILFSVPVGIGCLIAAIASQGHPAALICCLPFVLIAGYHGYRVFKAQATRIRIIGFKDRTLDVEFIGRMKKRAEFIDAFFERSGLGSVEHP
ncbi:MAG: hypothetical protein QM817_16045 [Archangium sp.]